VARHFISAPQTSVRTTGVPSRSGCMEPDGQCNLRRFRISLLMSLPISPGTTRSLSDGNDVFLRVDCVGAKVRVVSQYGLRRVVCALSVLCLAAHSSPSIATVRIHPSVRESCAPRTCPNSRLVKRCYIRLGLSTSGPVMRIPSLSIRVVVTRRRPRPSRLTKLIDARLE